MYKPEATRILDASAIPLGIIGSIKLYVRVGRMTKLVNVFVCDPLAVPTVIGYGFCDQIVENFYPKTRLVEQIDVLTALIARGYGKQRLAVTKNTKIVCFLIRIRHVSLRIRSTQHVRILRFSEAMITVQTMRVRLPFDNL